MRTADAGGMREDASTFVQQAASPACAPAEASLLSEGNRSLQIFVFDTGGFGELVERTRRC
jgi:hypothetical protein